MIAGTERQTNRRLWLVALVATLPLVALSVSSHTTRELPPLIDGLNGRVDVTGSLVSTPCILMPESQEQEISLGRTPLFDLKQTGDVTVPVVVAVKLDGCPGGRHALEDRQSMRGALWLSGQSGVRMRVTGVADPDDRRFFRVRGGALGVALRLAEQDGTLLSPDMTGRAIPLSPGRNDLMLQAQLWRKAQPLVPGEWYSVVHIDLEYE
ncbi:fimbrial protein [Kluyvera intermedia]|uniref:fimbrial protein n=1 Tax=Kluyvera intermedia TaxID=61648 RepID=UPI000789A78C|nr:fimbrial protein [Kluyvera intermedia]WQD29276.1 fimbrial protein [Kluyvera intermedia]VDZ85072.1 PAP fimbrial minor pilin protein precursor [Kluyvera intermedia]